MTPEMFWIATTAMALAVAAYLSWPLLRPQVAEEPRDGMTVAPVLERLLAEKETIYTAVKELQFDHAAGNLSERDYRELRDQYESRALAVLRLLDNPPASSQEARVSPDASRALNNLPQFGDKEWESLLEKEVASLRATRSGGAPVVTSPIAPASGSAGGQLD